MSTKKALTWAFICTTLVACGATTRNDQEAATVGEDPTPQQGAAAQPARTPQQPSAQPQKRLPVDLRNPEAIRTVLHRSATIFEGEVVGSKTSYDESLGPRTIATIEVINVRAGQNPGKTVDLAQFGGPVPDGTFSWASDTVQLETGSTYVFFLSNQTWHFKPWVSDPLRVTAVGGEEMLVGPQGRVVSALEPRGVAFGVEAASMESDPQAPTAALRPAALSKTDFFELLEEAMSVEGIRPSGSFAPEPKPVSANWRQIPAAAPPEEEP